MDGRVSSEASQQVRICFLTWLFSFYNIFKIALKFAVLPPMILESAKPTYPSWKMMVTLELIGELYQIMALPERGLSRLIVQ